MRLFIIDARPDWIQPVAAVHKSGDGENVGRQIILLISEKDS
jgi:hypothetical protein